jgi:hypothetical protein
MITKYQKKRAEFNPALGGESSLTIIWNLEPLFALVGDCERDSLAGSPAGCPLFPDYEALISHGIALLHQAVQALADRGIGHVEHIRHPVGCLTPGRVLLAVTVAVKMPQDNQPSRELRLAHGNHKLILPIAQMRTNRITIAPPIVV